MQHEASEISVLLDELDLDGSTQPFLVLADWLLDRGDPWGALITEQCNGITSLEWDQERKLLGLPDCWGVAFRRGFAEGVLFLAPAGGDTFAADLAALLAQPIAHLLERLDLKHARLPHIRALHAHRDRLGRLEVTLLDPEEEGAAVVEAIGDLPTVKISGGWLNPSAWTGSPSGPRLAALARAFATYDRAAESFVDGLTPQERNTVETALRALGDENSAARIGADGGSRGTYRYQSFPERWSYLQGSGYWLEVYRTGVTLAGQDAPMSRGANQWTLAEFVASGDALIAYVNVPPEVRERAFATARALLAELSR